MFDWKHADYGLLFILKKYVELTRPKIKSLEFPGMIGCFRMALNSGYCTDNMTK